MLTNRFILYSRKSSEPKEKQVYSIDDQNSECLKTVKKEELKLAYKLAEGKTAFKPHQRPQFDRMLDLILQGKADSILTWKPDRICRNPEEGGKVLQLLQDGVIKQIKTADGETFTQDSDHLILQIHFGMANQYSRNLSKSVKRGLDYKVQRGQYPRPALLGYMGVGEEGNRDIEPHPMEAPYVRLAYDLAKQGKSLTTIMETIYSKGFRSRKEKRISRSNWFRLLSDPTYYGCFPWKGELHQGSYTPLVSKSTFDEVQTVLHGRSKPQIKSWNHWTNGLMFCPICGCQVTTTVKNKHYERTERDATYLYLSCSHKRTKCDQKPITQDDFVKQLLPIIDQIKLDEETWRLGVDIFRAMNQEETALDVKALESVNREVIATRERIGFLIDMRTRNEITYEEFTKKKNELSNEETVLKESQTNLSNRGKGWLELAERFLNTAFYAQEILLHGLPEEKRNLILDLGSNLKLEDKRVIFEFKKPYDLLLQPKTPNWLPG